MFRHYYLIIFDVLFNNTGENIENQSYYNTNNQHTGKWEVNTHFFAFITTISNKIAKPTSLSPKKWIIRPADSKIRPNVIRSFPIGN